MGTRKDSKIDIKDLEKASKAYYLGKPIWSDTKFDATIIELQKSDPDHPFLKRIGSPPPGRDKKKHAIPMGSLNNAHDENEFLSWIPPGNPKIHLSHKIDGLSVELVYENGIFVRAITRGDGIEGEDVTQNVSKSGNIPFLIDKNITSVRCECVIHLSDWKKHFKEDANARNSAAGTIRRRNGHNAKYLQFCAFDAIGTGFKTEGELINLLRNYFRVPKHGISSDTYILTEWYKQEEKNRDALNYEIDGIVAKLDDRVKSQSLGSKNNRPLGQIAIKFKPRGDETILQDIKWQVGSTGTINPVGIVAPVSVGGTTINRVTLCNMDEIKRLGIAIGDTVQVIRAGDVIPKITKRLKLGVLLHTALDRIKIDYPKKCPECDGVVKRNGAHLFCLAPDCSGRGFSVVMNWIKKRNILNLGPGIVEAANIKTIHQLYICDIKDWTAIKVGNGIVGEKRAKKIIDELEKSKSVTLGVFLGSIGIKGCGRTLCNQIVKNLNITTLNDIFNLKPSHIEKLDGFGENRANDFIHWLDENRPSVSQLASFMNFKCGLKYYLTYSKEEKMSENTLDGEVICFTGKSPMPRKEMAELAEQAGCTVSSSITSKTTILVISDPDSVSTKTKKARELNIKLISPEEFLDIIRK